MSKMIVNLDEYFRQLVPPRDALLSELEQEAVHEGIPIIGPVVGELLYILARASKARQILELGTATGYSTIYLARACDELDGRVVSLERDARMAARAQDNLNKAHLGHRVEVRVGDALEEMAKMNTPFDLIFMDIDKEDYVHVLSHCERLLKSACLLVTDNVGFKKADDFNRALYNHPAWRTVHLLSLLPLHSPEKDGLSVALRC